MSYCVCFRMRSIYEGKSGHSYNGCKLRSTTQNMPLYMLSLCMCLRVIPLPCMVTLFCVHLTILEGPYIIEAFERLTMSDTRQHERCCLLVAVVSCQAWRRCSMVCTSSSIARLNFHIYLFIFCICHQGLLTASVHIQLVLGGAAWLACSHVAYCV